MELTPNIRSMFMVLLPMMFPMASPGLPLMQENTLTIISGRDVPNATIVNPIIRGDSLALTPKLVAPFTSQLAPRISAAKPRIRRNNDNNGDITNNYSTAAILRIEFNFKANVELRRAQIMS